MTSFELILDTNVTLLETPIWDRRTKQMYCTDLFLGNVYAFDPENDTCKLFATDGGAIGSAVPTSDPNRLLCALDYGICLYDLTTKTFTRLFDPNNGNKNNRYNDTRVDAWGRIFTSTVSKFYGTAEYRPDMLGNFYMIDIDGKVKTLVSGINQYNAIVWNTQNTEMFVIDTYHGKLLSFDYDVEHGPLGGPKERIDLSSIGTPDGMSIDADNNLYICHWAGKISVWDDSLTLKEIIGFPVDQVCCGGFGGEDMKDFYVATARYAYTDEQMKHRRGAGGLFRARVETPGTSDHFYPIK